MLLGAFHVVSLETFKTVVTAFYLLLSPGAPPRSAWGPGGRDPHLAWFCGIRGPWKMALLLYRVTLPVLLPGKHGREDSN